MNDSTTSRHTAGRDIHDPSARIDRLDQVSDDFEKDLLEARSLIDRMMARHRDRITRDALVSVLGAEDGEVASSAKQMIKEAKESVDVLLSGDPNVARAVNSAVGDLLVSGSQQVTVRMLCTRGTLDRKLAERASGTDGSLKLRIFAMAPLTAVIVDRREALVCAESSVGVRASMIRSPSVIQALGSLADTIWKSSTVTADRICFGDRVRSDTVRQVLSCLRLGLTDEVAARELEVSVRTYRRYVAEIMTLLGAESRFQAGAHASQRGLLAPLGPDSRDRADTQPAGHRTDQRAGAMS
ncbi:helix-turn-helix transcriptional regulator [Streptomyces sp. SL13]|uniref:Helix-turn-helix transcriptional regulator n=1 Tax=Streptantibioticus silvisoli TaxID=2705255 RepID=A0AA90K762_9ACTN|nr:helix-turn-helix transcriptional regulator [Streptantibioticus silvisoli]MDI5962435.1 helix-turn-helix transcriptional regulator [Streptantibioticus silvisoli]MDI5967947.1 helix-turn-helix transcriptional regulator [Streptantibioticus silvisoli]